MQDSQASDGAGDTLEAICLQCSQERVRLYDFQWRFFVLAGSMQISAVNPQCCCLWHVSGVVLEYIGLCIG
ncbi:hypothetical protein NDU88_001989 [Pleurodeles waltl]|uniref:Uncharacterized protein n=1 Tax=Pleurodeles waltl TaxID=8319 RepID=A0AAV7KUW2_PLEWA|nr:hypothetical protein NDU88_001989 [Pleurodeles waltl]